MLQTLQQKGRPSEVGKANLQAGPQIGVKNKTEQLKELFARRRTSTSRGWSNRSRFPKLTFAFFSQCFMSMSFSLVFRVSSSKIDRLLGQNKSLRNAIGRPEAQLKEFTSHDPIFRLYSAHCSDALASSSATSYSTDATVSSSSLPTPLQQPHDPSNRLPQTNSFP